MKTKDVSCIFGGCGRLSIGLRALLAEQNRMLTHGGWEIPIPNGAFEFRTASPSPLPNLSNCAKRGIPRNRVIVAVLVPQRHAVPDRDRRDEAIHRRTN